MATYDFPAIIARLNKISRERHLVKTAHISDEAKSKLVAQLDSESARLQAELLSDGLPRKGA